MYSVVPKVSRPTQRTGRMGSLPHEGTVRPLGAWVCQEEQVEPPADYAERLAQADNLLAEWLVRSWQRTQNHNQAVETT